MKKRQVKNEQAECEGRVEMRPLRVAGGFPCRRPAKFTVVWGGESYKVCGIHRRQFIGWGGKEA